MTRGALVVALLLLVVAASGAGSSAAEAPAVFVPFVAGGHVCEPSYPTLCLPSPPPDLNCPQIPYNDFAAVPPDAHHLDADNDGIACESPDRRE